MRTVLGRSALERRRRRVPAMAKMLAEEMTGGSLARRKVRNLANRSM
jgi:hypothetical protein